MLAALAAFLLAAAPDSTQAASTAIAQPSASRDSASPALPVDSTPKPPADSARAAAVPPPAEPPRAPAGPVGPVGPVGPIGPVISVPAPASGRMVFGPQGAEISIDTTTDLKGGGPSTTAGMGLSLLLPGAGHRYVGHPEASAFYHAIDLLGWTALFVSWQAGRSALSSAAEIANRYAGASLGSSPDENLLSAMRNFRSRRPVGGRHDSYDEAQILSGRSSTNQFPDDASHDWDWGATDNPDNNAHLRAFENQYRKWRTSQVALYSAAGTLVALRLVAAMDVLRLQRSSALRAGITLDTSPTPDGVKALISCNF